MSQPYGHEWVQKFDAYCEAFDAFERAIESATEHETSIADKKNIIKHYAQAQYLAGEAVLGFFKYQGDGYLTGRLDAFQLAFRRGLVTHGKALVKSCKSLQQSSYKNKTEMVDVLFLDILNTYYEAFKEVKLALSKRKSVYKARLQEGLL